MRIAKAYNQPPEEVADQAPDYAVGSNPNCATKIRLNHVGFTPGGGKYCVVANPPAADFVVHRHVLLENTGRVFEEAFRGVLRDGGGEIGPELVGDFSELSKEGLYYISCGPCKSRQFVIRRKVYDIPLRVLLNYFQMQRCGSPLGWDGPCHLDDGALDGSPRDFSGGHHQSCDLRKWPCLLNLGYLGLVQFGLRYSGPWDGGAVADEIRWGCDHYHKLLREDGGLFDSVCVPLGWGPREYYDSDAPAPALWNAVRHQALASLYFRPRDGAYADKCLAMARRVWTHMVRPDRPVEAYRAPKLPPRGHDHWNDFFAGFYPGSALDTAHQLCAAAALRRATGERLFHDDVANCATALAKLQLPAGDGSPGTACFRETAGSPVLADSSIYFWQSSGPQGLCDALELAADHPEAELWRSAIRRVAEQCRMVAERNPYGRVPGLWRGVPEGIPSYQYYSYGYNMDIIAQAVFLRRAAAALGEPAYQAVAQRQLDHVLGGNLFDMSSVEGVGYNQMEHCKTGEFLPPTPQIPGAVNTGVGSSGVEYDAPPTGWLMWLLAETSQA